MCPELHRRMLNDEVTDPGSDAALIGTSCHAAVEALMQGSMFNEAVTIAYETLEEGWTQVSKHKYGSLSIAMGAVETGINTFVDCIYGDELSPLDVVGTEAQFTELIYDDPFREIYIQGTIDLLMKHLTVDFKFSERSRADPKQAWKYRRYDPQSVLYTYARSLLEGNSTLRPFWFYTISPVMPGRWEKVEIPVSWADIHSVVIEAMQLAHMIESEAPAWPLNPSDWHCSPEWCPNWSNCMGLVLGSDPWGSVAKKQVAMDKKIAKQGSQ